MGHAQCRTHAHAKQVGLIPTVRLQFAPKVAAMGATVHHLMSALAQAISSETPVEFQCAIKHVITGEIAQPLTHVHVPPNGVGMIVLGQCATKVSL